MSSVSNHRIIRQPLLIHQLPTQLEKKREDFRKYLEDAGAIDNLTQALIKLYEEQNKPLDAVKFIRKNMCSSCPDDEDFTTLTADLGAANRKICELERELSKLRGTIKRTRSEVDLALMKGFEDLNSDERPSLLKKYLTKDVIEQLKAKKTSFKGTLLDCVLSGFEFLDSPIGVFACDPEAYCAFAALFEPLIEELHDFTQDDQHPELDWGEPCKLPEVDPTGENIVSCRMSCSRSVENFPLTAIMGLEHYEEIMKKFRCRTECMSGDLKGKFYALEGMDPEVKKKFADENIFFSEDNAILKAANGTRFWPTGRGVFVNNDKTFVIWCNEEDHLRFISTDQGGNLRDIYERLMTGVTQVSKDIPFSRDERFGFPTFSPNNLGNTLHVSVQLKLENLPKKQAILDELVEKFGVKVSKLSGDEDSNVYEVKSTKRLGYTEFETVKEFAEAIVGIIGAEKSLVPIEEF